MNTKSITNILEIKYVKLFFSFLKSIKDWINKIKKFTWLTIIGKAVFSRIVVH